MDVYVAYIHSTHERAVCANVWIWCHLHNLTTLYFFLFIFFARSLLFAQSLLLVWKRIVILMIVATRFVISSRYLSIYRRECWEYCAAGAIGVAADWEKEKQDVQRKKKFVLWFLSKANIRHSCANQKALGFDLWMVIFVRRSRHHQIIMTCGRHLQFCSPIIYYDLIIQFVVNSVCAVCFENEVTLSHCVTLIIISYAN